MTAYLLDVNVLLAMSWPGHQFHETAERWFARHAAKAWATCPIVEAGFVRIISNPAFSPRAVSVKEALAALAQSAKHPGHQFWPDDLTLSDGIVKLKQRITGHQQITDVYLLGLAIHRKGKLATLDRAIAALDPGGFVELLS